jgi:hypothetical protein
VRFSPMRYSSIIVICLTALLPVRGQNLQAPDSGRRATFAGEWRLALKKSNMGSDHPGANYEFTKTFQLKGSAIVQTDHEVNVDVIGFAVPERNSTEELVPDGLEHTVQRPGFFPGTPPKPTQVTAEWQGDNLVLSESSQSLVGPMTTSRRYFLSDDSAQLIELIVRRTSFGDSEQRLVFTRVSEVH